MPENLQINDIGIQIDLYGVQGDRGDSVPSSGKRLMDEMWRRIRATGLKSKGINHWVYLANSEMFVGVEFADEAEGRADIINEAGLTRLSVKLDRCLLHVHRGPYTELPAIWPRLFERLRQQGETPILPQLEIYGHWNADPTRCETTIVIGLA